MKQNDKEERTARRDAFDEYAQAMRFNRRISSAVEDAKQGQRMLTDAECVEITRYIAGGGRYARALRATATRDAVGFREQ